MHQSYPKNGSRGKAPGFTHRPTLQEKEVETDFYGSQGAFAKDEAAERMDLYAKPGTSAARRRSGDDLFNTSMPTSRYRSRRP